MVTLGVSLALALGGTALAPPAPATAATTSVKVLSWNISGPTTSFLGARFDAVVNTIKGQNPDIIALQEVHQAAGTTVSYGGSTYPGINQVEALKTRLGYPYFIWARGDGNGNGGAAGNLLLSRYPILESLNTVMPNAICPGPGDKSGVSGCPVNRSFAGMKIRVNGVDIRAYTSHFSTGTGDVGAAGRAAQSSYVKDRLQSPPITSAFVFAGDLNARPGDPDRRKFGGIGMRDAWTEAHPNDDASGLTHVSGERIDYQWISPGFDATEIRVLPSPAVGIDSVSDHRLLVSTLTVRDPTQAGGVSSTEGWAGARRAGTAVRLWVCDDTSNANGVIGVLENADTGDNVIKIPDDKFADQCRSATGSVSSTVPLQVVICRNQSGSSVDCVRKRIS
jgi:endonuclease/exonuclease/phosphatase family metal-dependent hydrolase